MHFFYTIVIASLLGGCVFKNENGFSTKYYNDCVEYYDAQGIYHKRCDKNFISNDKIKSFFSNEKKENKNAWKPKY